MELAKLGIRDLHLWDFDIVEEHNVANQLFGIGDVGKTKVDALTERIVADTGISPTPHNEAVDEDTSLYGVVFLLVDTMSGRRTIWDGAIKLKPFIDLMIETRMGADEGRIYVVQPMVIQECRKWEATLYDDDEASESLCGSRVSVGSTAAFVHALATWSLIRWFRWFQDSEPEIDKRPSLEILFHLDPPMIIDSVPASAVSSI